MDFFDAVRPLNQLLCEMHGPTDNIARTMSRLVPFPDGVPSLPDADLLDLNVLVESDVCTGRGDAAVVEARARYATSHRVAQVFDFYERGLERAGAVPAPVSTGDLSESPADLAMVLADGRTRFDVSVTVASGYRIVKVLVRYDRFDPGPIFDRFAHWHSGKAPIDTDQPTAVEISTFASGRRPETLVLYRTDYECPATPWSIRRAMVESRIDELGWTYNEPREGIMFIHVDGFDTETHVLGDEHGSNVTFVGEFQLR